MTLTDLDDAHHAMQAAPEDDGARLRFYERLADTELFLLLAEDAAGDQVTPEIFTIDGAQFVLVCDREDRLSEFVGRAVPYAAMSGRGLAEMLDGKGVGLALNLQVAPSEMLVPAAAVDWLVVTLSNRPEAGSAHIRALHAPTGLPETLIASLDRKLATAAGLAHSAYLVAATYDDGTKGHVLAFVDAVPDAQPALAQAASEALTFSGIAAGMMDVLFVDASDAIAARLARAGLRFDLPKPEAPAQPSAPGSDPARPPKLR